MSQVSMEAVTTAKTKAVEEINRFSSEACLKAYRQISNVISALEEEKKLLFESWSEAAQTSKYLEDAIESLERMTSPIIVNSKLTQSVRQEQIYDRI